MSAILKKTVSAVLAALLLLSRKAGSYITGSALYVDGGFTCSWF